MALQTSIVSLAAISAVMLIVTRNFDLSVGSAVALVGVILAVLTIKHDVNPGPAIQPLLLAGVVGLGDDNAPLLAVRLACIGADQAKVDMTG